jgi:uncharacterized membrane protein YuzA (DUF378 family)
MEFNFGIFYFFDTQIWQRLHYCLIGLAALLCLALVGMMEMPQDEH